MDAKAVNEGEKQNKGQTKLHSNYSLKGHYYA